LARNTTAGGGASCSELTASAATPPSSRATPGSGGAPAEGGQAPAEMPAVDSAAWQSGRVLRVHRLFSVVETEDGRHYRCAVRRLLRTLATDERNIVTPGARVWFRLAAAGAEAGGGADVGVDAILGANAEVLAVVAGDVGLGPTKRFDDAHDVLDEVTDRVRLGTGRGIGQAVAAKVGRDSEAAGLRQRVDLPGPGLRAYREPVKHEDHLAVGRAVDHRSKAKPVRPDHVLGRGHLQLELMKSAATSSAWSSTAVSPWP